MRAGSLRLSETRLLPVLSHGPPAQGPPEEAQHSLGLGRERGGGDAAVRLCPLSM